MGELGLDPETALRLIKLLLRGAGYFFAGFAVLGVSLYVVFLCKEIFAARPSPKTRIAKVRKPLDQAPEAERKPHVIPAQTLALVEAGTATRGEAVIDQG
jgi:hypothetical protein